MSRFGDVEGKYKTGPERKTNRFHDKQILSFFKNCK